MPGYTAYILDFLYAANSVISNSDLKGVPRTEATSIVGSLLAFPPILQNIPLLLPNPNEISLISSTDVKDQIIGKVKLLSKNLSSNKFNKVISLNVR